MIVRALSEMSVEDPRAGAFSYYATRYWSKRAGFVSGWNYWFNYISCRWWSCRWWGRL